MSPSTLMLLLGLGCLAAFVGVVWTGVRSAARRAAVMREETAPSPPPAEVQAPDEVEEAPVLHLPEPDPLSAITEIGSIYALSEHLLVMADQLLELGEHEAKTVQDAGYRLEALADALDAERVDEDDEEAYHLLTMLEYSEGQVRATYLPLEDVAAFLDESLGELSVELPTEGLAEAVVQAFEALRLREERTWTEPTTNDRLTDAFQALQEQGILALESCGWSTDDGWVELCEARDDERPAGWGHGACFFHEQDVERGVRGQGLMLTFGPLHPDEAEDDALAARIGRTIVEVLEAHEVPVAWSGDTAKKIAIPSFPWRRRRAS